MSKAHKFGKWTREGLVIVSREQLAHVDAERFTITVSKGFNCTDNEALSVARMIAAAPELLEALQFFVNVCENGNPMEFATRLGEACKKAKSAIAKGE